jgi:hypothetical protein
MHLHLLLSCGSIFSRRRCSIHFLHCLLLASSFIFHWYLKPHFLSLSPLWFLHFLRYVSPLRFLSSVFILSASLALWFNSGYFDVIYKTFCFIITSYFLPDHLCDLPFVYQSRPYSLGMLYRHSFQLSSRHTW